MSIWDKTVNNQIIAVPEQTQNEPANLVLDEEVMSELQENPDVDIFEEEEDDTQQLMSDANLRLEQGRLYQMVLQGDIFADTNADPRAIKNVQREIRKFVRERMETMLGIRQEQPKQEAVVSSPFNDLEVTALKMLASRVTKGATEEVEQVPVPVSPKKDGISSISGSLRPSVTPLSNKPKTPVNRTKPQPQPQKQVKSKPVEKELESNLTKPIEQMSATELAAHDAAAVERRAKNYAKTPTNLVPHPSPQQLEMMYTTQANSVMQPGTAVNTIMSIMNKR
jgi:hypothetical protein